jgi:hypothetical protein
MSVRLSAYISATPTGRIFVKFDIGDFMKVCRGTTNLVMVEQKRRTLHERLTKFQCRQRFKIAITASLTAICIATMRKERIVEFPQQQWLRERATILRYT